MQEAIAKASSRDLDEKSKIIQKNIDLQEKYGETVEENLEEAEKAIRDCSMLKQR